MTEGEIAWRCVECGSIRYRDSQRCANDDCVTNQDGDGDE